MTDVQVLEVIAKIKMLDPQLVSNYTDEQVLSYIQMAVMFIEVSGIEIPEDKYVFAVAVKTLALLSTPENSSLDKQKIKDVEVTYFGGQGKGKWDSLFDSIITGVTDDTALYYVGI